MSIGLRITVTLCAGLLLLNQACFAVYVVGLSPATLERLEKLRFGHTNWDIRLKERLDVIEWSVMGGRQPGSPGERLAAVEQKLESEGPAASISYGPTYNPARPRTGYLVGSYGRRRAHRVRQKVIVVAQAQRRHMRYASTTASTTKPKPAPAVVAGKSKLSPEVVTGLIRKGNDLYIAGDYQRSVQELTRAIKLDPVYAPAYVSRGYAYRKLGRTDMEKSDFQLARKLDSHIQLPM